MHKKNSLYSFLLSPLTFLVMFDRLSYSKYLFKYVILYVVFKLYLVIKQIIIKYVTIFNFFSKTNKSTAIIKKEWKEYLSVYSLHGSSTPTNWCHATGTGDARGRRFMWSTNC
jgi:hypothetical protein